MVKSESGHGFMGTGGVMMVENPDKSPGSSKYITEQAYMEEVKYGKTKLEKEADDKSRKVEGYLILKRLIEEEMQTVFYGAVMLQSRHRQGWYHDEDMALKEMEKIKLRKPVSAYIANYLTMQYGKRYYSKSYYDKECSTFEKEHEQLKEKFGSLSEFQPTSYDELEREIKRTKKIIHKSRRSKDCYKCLKFWYNSFFCCGVGLEMNNGHGYIERGCQPVRCGESWGDTQSWGLSNNKSYFQKEQCQGRMIIGCCCCVLPFCTPDPQWIFGELCWTNERWFGCFRQELAENWCNCCCCCCISNYFNYYTGTANASARVRLQKLEGLLKSTDFAQSTGSNRPSVKETEVSEPVPTSPMKRATRPLRKGYPPIDARFEDLELYEGYVAEKERKKAQANKT